MGLTLGGLLLAAPLGVALLAWLVHWASLRQQDDAPPHDEKRRGRFARPRAFLRARTSPGRLLGLQLTWSALVLIAAGWVFGRLAEAVSSAGQLVLVDAQVAQWFHHHATPAMTQAMLGLSHLHGPTAISVMTVLVAAWLIRQRQWHSLSRIVLTVPTGLLLNVLVKQVFHRARPQFDEPLLTLSTYSFPSGHVAGTTLFYGVLCVLLWARVDALGWRVAGVAAAMAVTTLVAVSRLYLGVHFLTDVLAGFAGALVWLTLCLFAIDAYWRRRADVHA
ncbi:MAG: phosphatase PAP2 family protein [Pseudomonadota bacterium]